MTKEQSHSIYALKYAVMQKEIDRLNKIIDMMAEQLAGLAIFDEDKDNALILGDKEEVKQYFINKAKEI